MMNTKEMKHTPGPWHVANMANGDAQITTSWGHLLAIVHGGSKEARDIENARLMSAAPELLTLLRDLLPDYKAEIRRSAALSITKRQVNFQKLPIVARAEELLGRFAR